MKKIYKLSFLVLVFHFVNIQFVYSQAPTLSSIQGLTVVCSSANAATGNYSVTATNNPTFYSWTVISSNGSATFSNPNAANTTVSFSTLSGFASFTLICYAQNGSGPSIPVTRVVKIFETPSVTFSGSNTLCQGGSGNLSASSTSSTLFQSSSTTISWAPSTGLSSTSSPSVIANPPSTTNYTILTSFGPCTSTNYFLVTVVSPAPVVNAIFSPSIICAGEKSILTVTGTAVSYSVNGMQISGPVTYSPASNATYTVNATGTGNCLSANSIIALTVNACSGINELKEKASILNFYPNPNNGSFTVRSETDASVMLFTELGQQIRTFNIRADSETTITGLSAGIYFIVTGDQRKKIIVTP